VIVEIFEAGDGAWRCSSFLVFKMAADIKERRGSKSGMLVRLEYFTPFPPNIDR
jgi:hypothetical protein